MVAATHQFRNILAHDMLGEARRRGPTPRWWPLRGHPEQQRAILAALAYGIRFLFLDSGRRSGKTDLAKRFSDLQDRGHPSGSEPAALARSPLLLRDADAGPGEARGLAGSLETHSRRLDRGREIRPQRELRRTLGSHVVGGRVMGVGHGQPGPLRRPPWDGGVLDEMCDQQEGCFDLHVRPGLDTVENGVNRRGWCWMIGKPSRKGPERRWFRERCEKCRKGEYEDGAAFTWSSESVLPEETIRQLRQTLSAKDYAEQVKASWQNAGGGIYHAFSQEEGCGNVQPCERRDNLPICVGSDFNVDPMCWVLAHRIGDRLEVFDELIIRDCNTPRALNEFGIATGTIPAAGSFTATPAAGRGRPRPRRAIMPTSGTMSGSRSPGAAEPCTTPATIPAWKIGSRPRTRGYAMRKVCGGCLSIASAGD